MLLRCRSGFIKSFRPSTQKEFSANFGWKVFDVLSKICIIDILMIGQNPILGKLVSIHPVSPAFLQRGVIISVLSFLFFLGTMAGFYISRNPLYFLLSTAFLIVYIATMFSWISVRKNVLTIYENGVQYKKFSARWNEIQPIELTVTSKMLGGEKIELKLTKKTGEQIVLNETIFRINEVIEKISENIEGREE
jgi:hypothetical protein